MDVTPCYSLAIRTCPNLLGTGNFPDFSGSWEMPFGNADL